MCYTTSICPLFFVLLPFFLNLHKTKAIFKKKAMKNSHIEDITTFLKKLAETILLPIKRYSYFYVLISMLTYATFAISTHYGKAENWWLIFFMNAFYNYFICFLLTLFSRIKLDKIAAFVYGFLLLSELYIALAFHTMYSLHMVQLVLETNNSECTEFLSTTFASSYFWIAVVAFAALAALAFPLHKLGQKVCRHTPIKILFVILLIFSGLRVSMEVSRAINLFSLETTNSFVLRKKHPKRYTLLNRILYGLAFNKISSAELDKLLVAVEKTDFDTCSFKVPNIVLIIGESYNKYHTSLYNKNYKNTTPLLKKRVEDGDLVLYNDVITPFNKTSEVFRQTFSTFDFDNPNDDWTAHTLFTAIFRKAGYNVYFYTNQFVTSSNDRANTMGGTILNHPQLSKLQFTKRNDQAYVYDEELVDSLPMSEIKERPSLLIVHLIGQHVDYSCRYPSEFNVYKPTDYDNKYAGEYANNIIANYDNSILYNDYVVNKIFEKFDNDDAICIYMADHGNELFDWRDKYNRTYEPEITSNIARYQYEVPLMFFMPQKFKTAHPELAEKIKLNENKPYVNSYICHTLFNMAGISCREYNSAHDVLSDSYEPKRLLLNKFDYDEIMSKEKAK